MFITDWYIFCVQGSCVLLFPSERSLSLLPPDALASWKNMAGLAEILTGQVDETGEKSGGICRVQNKFPKIWGRTPKYGADGGHQEIWGKKNNERMMMIR